MLLQGSQTYKGGECPTPFCYTWRILPNTLAQTATWKTTLQFNQQFKFSRGGTAAKVADVQTSLKLKILPEICPKSRKDLTSFNNVKRVDRRHPRGKPENQVLFSALKWNWDTVTVVLVCGMTVWPFGRAFSTSVDKHRCVLMDSSFKFSLVLQVACSPWPRFI